jgi:tripartite-type tricarboxylate transporter receptor subunit TctC
MRSVAHRLKQAAKIGLAIVVPALTAAMASVAANAEKISDRQLTIIVPFTPGTGIDILARTLGEEMRVRWGQTVIVENKPGASGNIGTVQAARATPDGLTLLLTVNTFVMNAALFKSLPYDPEKGFAPIAPLATGELALVVHPGLGVDTAAGLITASKAEPTKINYGSPGVGTPQHLAMELFKLKTGAALTHVPYGSGSAGAVRDLIGGHIQAMFLPVHTVLPQVADKRMHMLAIGSAQRSKLAPDVPTIAETGVKDFEVGLWYGLLAPVGTPTDMIERLNKAANEILSTPAVAASLAKQGLVVSGGTPEDLAKMIARDVPRWIGVARDAGIAAE